MSINSTKLQTLALLKNLLTNSLKFNLASYQSKSQKIPNELRITLLCGFPLFLGFLNFEKERINIKN